MARRLVHLKVRRKPATALYYATLTYLEDTQGIAGYYKLIQTLQNATQCGQWADAMLLL